MVSLFILGCFYLLTSKYLPEIRPLIISEFILLCLCRLTRIWTKREFGSVYLLRWDPSDLKMWVKRRIRMKLASTNRRTPATRCLGSLQTGDRRLDRWSADHHAFQNADRTVQICRQTVLHLRPNVLVDCKAWRIGEAGPPVCPDGFVRLVSVQFGCFVVPSQWISQ